ncbi:MAG: hypothetical protein ACI94Y_003923 [Maribacter sp.]|jgi:hypothetical protein
MLVQKFWFHRENPSKSRSKWIRNTTLLTFEPLKFINYSKQNNNNKVC